MEHEKPISFQNHSVLGLRLFLQSITGHTAASIIFFRDEIVTDGGHFTLSFMRSGVHRS